MQYSKNKSCNITLVLMIFDLRTFIKLTTLEKETVFLLYHCIEENSDKEFKLKTSTQLN